MGGTEKQGTLQGRGHGGLWWEACGLRKIDFSAFVEPLTAEMGGPTKRI